MKWHLAATWAALCFVSGALAQPTVFTYQGRLNSNNAAANGSFDLRFTLHDAVTNGTQVSVALTNAPIGVANGLFTTALDFGSVVFDGTARWLQIGVRTNGDTNQYVFLSPRQQLTATPYAIRAANAGTAGTAVSLTAPLATTNLSGIVQFSNLPPNLATLNSNANFTTPVFAPVFVGSLPGSNIVGKVADSALSTNVALLNTNAYFKANVAGSNFFGNGIGLTNVPGRIFEVIPTATNIQALANFGYLCTNETAAVVVTLPDAPNIRIGETIRVSGSGAGGWTVAQNAGQTILMGNLANSIAQGFVSRGVSINWRGVASSADGKKLVATANPGGIYTSTDYGTTWSPQAASPLAYCVASSADGVKLVAGLNSGNLYTSLNSGSGWTARFSPASWIAVASSLDGVKLMAIAQGVGIYGSTDSGVNWGSKLAGNYTAIASSADGTRLAATASGGQIYTSSDSGANWVPHGSSLSWVALACSADGSRLVAAISSGQLYVSPDYGTNWFPTGPSISGWSAVTSSADGAYLAAIFGSGGIYISSDSGVTWSSRFISSAIGWTGVAMSSDASTVAVVGTGSLIQVSSQATTTVGVTGGLIGARLAAVELEYCGGGVFIPLSYVGSVRGK